jgi:hypothetical protein
MKYVKKLNLNRKRPASQEFNVVTDRYNQYGVPLERIETNSVVSTQIPSGPASTRPNIFKNGQLRYSQTLQELEAYVNGTWEILRTIRQPDISYKSYSNANYLNTIFGPLAYDTDLTKPQNVSVFVENVQQLPDTSNIPGSNISGNFSLVFTPSVVTNLTTPVVQGAITLNLKSLQDVAGGINQKISGAGIAPGSVVQSITSTITNSIRISTPTTAPIATTTNLTFTFSTGTYVQFTGPAPSKTVYTLQGYDGYFPTPNGLFES